MTVQYEVFVQDTTAAGADVAIRRAGVRYIFVQQVPAGSDPLLRIGSTNADQLRLVEGREIDCGEEVDEFHLDWSAVAGDLELVFSPACATRMAPEV